MRAFIFLIVTLHVCLGIEPHCSKFHYEEKMLEKMIRTEIKFEQLQEEFKKLTTDYQIAMATVREVKGQIKTERMDMRDEFHQLNVTTISRIEEHLRNSKDVFQQKEKKIERMSDDLRGLYEDLKKNISESVVTPIVSFKATGLKTNSPTYGETLVFPSILFNIADGYDSSTGIFKAPVSGLYLFTTQICAFHGVCFVFDVMVNGKQLGQGQTYDKDIHPCNSADVFGYMEGGQTAYTSVKHISGDQTPNISMGVEPLTHKSAEDSPDNSDSISIKDLI